VAGREGGRVHVEMERLIRLPPPPRPLRMSFSSPHRVHLVAKALSLSFSFTFFSSFSFPWTLSVYTHRSHYSIHSTGSQDRHHSLLSHLQSYHGPVPSCKEHSSAHCSLLCAPLHSLTHTQNESSPEQPHCSLPLSILLYSTKELCFFHHHAQNIYLLPRFL